MPTEETKNVLVTSIHNKTGPIYQGKLISEMTDIELDWTLNSLEDQLNDVNEKREKMKQKKMFQNQELPPINSVFVQMLEATRSEKAKRTKVKNAQDV